MKIPESTQEKSLLLARLLGWRCVYAADSTCAVMQGRAMVGISSAYWYTEDGPHLDFYEAENMALAWRIMTSLVEKEAHIKIEFQRWWCSQELYLLKSPKMVQKLWLDRILQLALEAELIAA
jgi:hypothetical protein